MIPLALILILAGTLAGITLVAILAWFCCTAYLEWCKRRLERRKGVYRALIAELASGDRQALDPELHRPEVLLDLEGQVFLLA